MGSICHSKLMVSTAITLIIGLGAAQTAHAQTQNQNDVAQTTQSAAANVTLLDVISISATMGTQAAIDSMSGTSVVDTREIERIQPVTAADLLRNTPGVWATPSGDDPSTAINIRGLQQYGRVAVTLDGARQDFWRVGHGSGSFFIEPELLKQVTVIRGPVSNGYGTGAIGGVVAFETKSAGDFLKDAETWALSEKVRYESNGNGWLSSTTGAYRFNDNFDVIGNFTWRNSDEYKDGNGNNVRWTGEQVNSGFGKITFRPAEGHEVKLGATVQRYNDVLSGSSGSTSTSLSRYDTKTTVENYTGSYTFNPVENDYIDFSLNAYHSKTRSDQLQVWPRAAIGASRYYDVATTGFGVRNASRFEAAGLHHTLTYGGDYAYLTGKSDADHFGNGNQTAYGAYLQWEGKYDTWLDLIAAVRYDGYRLDGSTKGTPSVPSQAVSISGERWSPRATIGITPVEGLQFYGTYAEGYRAPHLQDMFRQNGAHNAAGYEPNLFLRPEVARTWEAGVNFKFNDVAIAGDHFRAKVNVFSSLVDDYIEPVVIQTRPRLQSAMNVGTAELKGIELEGVYDFTWGYLNASASFVDAKMKTGIYAGDTLSNTPLNNFGATLGLRALEDRLTYGVQYQSIGAVTRVLSTGAVEYPRVDLVNLFANWQINDNFRFDFAVENLFNKAYTDPASGWATSTDIEQGKGRTFKIALTGRFGG